MHQKKSQIHQIGKESSGTSSNFNSTPISFLPSIRQKHLQIQTQPQKHPQIQIPPLSPSHQTRFQHEPICQSPSTNKTTPHKRPIMSQSPPTLPRSPTLSSLHHHHHHHHRKVAVLDSLSSQTSSLFSSSFALLLATKTIAQKLVRHSRCSRWLRVHLQFFILLSLPSFYFFTSTLHWPFFLHFLPVLAFSAVLLITLNLALHRLPSIRLFLARSFPIKLSSSTSSESKPRPPVVWSIGSKPKSKKRPNSGSWIQVYSNGDVYEGEFYKGKCSGSGVCYYYMSGRYEGDWVDEKYDGHGVETWARGSRYRGQYRQGLRYGFGVYRFYTGDAYAGEWCNGQCHGCGVYTCEDGSWYVGEFKWGVKHGLGHYHFRNGDTYGGEYFADKMHGFGVYRFENGQRYEGAWHEGRRQGLGMYTFRNGETQSGHWENGMLNVSSTEDMLPGSPFALNHSKVLNAVQEARRADEQAIDVSKMDDKVNRAVAAANKAANAARVAAVKAVQNQMHHYNNNNDDDDVPIPIV